MLNTKGCKMPYQQKRAELLFYIRQCLLSWIVLNMLPFKCHRVRCHRVSRTLASLGQDCTQNSLVSGMKDLVGQKGKENSPHGCKTQYLPMFLVQITSHLHSRPDMWTYANHISSLFVALEAAVTCWVTFKLLFPLEHLVWRWPSHSSVCLFIL